jgi:hypothetical protein
MSGVPGSSRWTPPEIREAIKKTAPQAHEAHSLRVHGLARRAAWTNTCHQDQTKPPHEGKPSCGPDSRSHT